MNIISHWLSDENDFASILANKTKLPTTFYSNDTLSVAHSLVGKLFVKLDENQMYLAGIIAETEAYLEHNDRASHSHRGKTIRNAAMFGRGGNLYIYKIFGVHYCANVVTEKEDYGCAVLLRALIPIAGTELMMKRRGLTDIKSLCRGPGNLTKSFSLDYRHNKASLSSNSLFILNTELSDKHQIITSQRIGISKDTELPYRFFIKNCPYVSGKKSYYL